jgi:transposase
MPATDPYGGFVIPEHLHVDALSFDGDLVTVHASTDDPAARCPCCEQPSRRVHGRYTRTLADLPWGGVPVLIQVRGGLACVLRPTRASRKRGCPALLLVP